MQVSHLQLCQAQLQEALARTTTANNYLAATAHMAHVREQTLAAMNDQLKIQLAEARAAGAGHFSQSSQVRQSLVLCL